MFTITAQFSTLEAAAAFLAAAAGTPGVTLAASSPVVQQTAEAPAATTETKAAPKSRAKKSEAKETAETASAPSGAQPSGTAATDAPESPATDDPFAEEPAEVKTYTYDDLVKALQAHHKAVGAPAFAELLTKYGVKKVPELKEKADQFAAIMKDIAPKAE